MSDVFDILRKLPDGGIVWITTVKDLTTARERIKVFANYKPGEYVIFSQESQSVVTAPCVPFALPKNKAARKEAKKKLSTSTPRRQQVIAGIVADSAEAFRHKR
jgi:hypothetical protein